MSNTGKPTEMWLIEDMLLVSRSLWGGVSGTWKVVLQEKTIVFYLVGLESNELVTPKQD